MSNYDPEPFSYEKQGPYDCRRVPIAMFKQSHIWVDAKRRVIPIENLEDGHLDNLIGWIKMHADHWNHPVLVSPLMRALEKEQKKRIPKRNTTPRQAMKDTLLNDAGLYVSTKLPVSGDLVSIILQGLDERGFEVRKKNG